MLKKVGALLFVLSITFFNTILMGIEKTTNYFPATLGSYWVYEDQDGNELTRRAVEGEEIAGEMYHAFEYEPEFENWEDYDYHVHPTLFKVDETGIKYLIDDNVKKSYKQRLTNELQESVEKSAQNMPPEAQFKPNFDVEIENQSHFILLKFPITLNEEWETTRIKPTLDIKVNFNSPDVDPELAGYITGSILYFTIFETGIILTKETVDTLAGKYEDCLKIEYRTETVMPKLHGGDGPKAGESVTTLWLAPNIGIVKYHQEVEKPILSDFGNPETTTHVKTYELKKYEIVLDTVEAE